MSKIHYPAGTVRDLLATDKVTPPTRAALNKRLKGAEAISFFDPATRAILEAVCDRLFPQSQTDQKIDLRAELETRLKTGPGNGWRYDLMPPDTEMYRRGLQGLDDTARTQFGQAFVELSVPQQEEVLRSVQGGQPVGETWQDLDARRFFEELLAELSEFYYSHPLSQEAIGYVGMADAPGWQALGLNRLEEWEPLPVADDANEPVERPARRTVAALPVNPPLPPMRRYDLTEEVDAVVIGTGAGGAPLLARLADAGLKVVALEAGRYWQPGQDFATDERAQTKLFWSDERLSAGADPVAFGNNNSGIGVGGSTLHYTAYTPRVQPDDLRLHSEFGLGHDWPLDYTDLEPYYDELEGFLGISGPSPYPWGPTRRQAYPLPPLPLNGAAQLMQRGSATLGIRTSPAANAALSQAYYQPGVGWRPACTNRGFCQAGCSIGAKASLDVTFIPLAIGAGAEVRPECFVSRFERDGVGRLSGVVYNEGGQEKRQRCRAVFMCAGAVETPRLLLINELANDSGQVGRNFMAHTGLQIWGCFEDDVRPYKGIPGGLISEDTHRPTGADFAGGYLLQSIGVMPVTYASQVARGRGLWGQAGLDHMTHYNHIAGINILGECLPYDHNYLELSDELDGRGLPKPRVFFSQGDNEQRLTAHADQIMRDIWGAAGADDIWAFPRNAHIIGTCRMGNDPASSVVGPDGKAWDVPNLYIVDNSVFPSALSANPALTIMALSLRTADLFLGRLARQESL